MSTDVRNDSKWRRERRQAATQPKPRKPARDDGCVCDTGPVIVATSRRSQLTLAIEHWPYCPVPHIPLDVDTYAKTGARIPIGALS